ncbi:M55 family metallopeptidase [Pelomonas sp. KK5]|uniref:M55 family metallopeptidase n=1 Tax=Pelomonas sp. KK5 TaxID=1855730 RepID=UPI00097CB463|nr:M55 family metallopeptidase [Pelomonas sp. KK5]
MKVYLSADIEGIACISAPSECDMNSPDYPPMRAQMTAEVAAACEAAFDAGTREIVVKDAHWTGRNIDPRGLHTPEGKSLQLIRGWSGHPFSMVQGIDASFQRALFVGYHSAAGSGGNPLAHTVSGRLFSRIELNGRTASEFYLFALAAASMGVPVCFLSGDQAQCEEAGQLIDGITTVATLRGEGPSAVSLLPDAAVRQIRDGVRRAIAGPLPALLPMPRDFVFKLSFAKAAEAYARSFIPGVRQVSDTQLLLETSNYFDVLTVLKIAARMQ